MSTSTASLARPETDRLPTDRRDVQAALAEPLEGESTACFSVHAAAEPGVMPRVLELFAKRGLVPSAWHSRVNGGELTIDIQMHGLAGAPAEYIAACLRQIAYVAVVLISEKRSPRRA
jgi:acetolactate synthase small subunit